MKAIMKRVNCILGITVIVATVHCKREAHPPSETSEVASMDANQPSLPTSRWAALQVTAQKCCPYTTGFIQCVVNEGHYLDVFTTGIRTSHPEYHSEAEGRNYLCDIIGKQSLNQSAPTVQAE